MSTSTEKVQLTYGVRTVGNIITGETTRRAFPIANGSIGLDRFCKILSTDYGLMAGRESHIRGTITSILNAVLEEMKKGQTVTFDNYLRFRPSFRGPVDAETGKPSAETELCVTVQTLKRMKLEIGSFDLINRDKSAALPKITEIYACLLGAERDKIVRSKDFQLSGRNLYFDAAMGDTVTLSFKAEDDEMQSISATPTECNPASMRFTFPAALAEVEDGTPIEITLRTRMGVADGVLSSTSRTAILVKA